MKTAAKNPEVDFGLVVDTLGALKAEIANLKAREDALVAALREAGPGAFEGAKFRATVGVSDRAVVNRATFIAELVAVGVPESKIVEAEFKATTVSPATTVRVSARKS